MADLAFTLRTHTMERQDRQNSHNNTSFVLCLHIQNVRVNVVIETFIETSCERFSKQSREHSQKRSSKRVMNVPANRVMNVLRNVPANRVITFPETLTRLGFRASSSCIHQNRFKGSLYYARHGQIPWYAAKMSSNPPVCPGGGIVGQHISLMHLTC